MRLVAVSALALALSSRVTDGASTANISPVQPVHRHRRQDYAGNENGTTSLTKRAFSQARSVFVAGLEGTGHHLIGSMFNKCLGLSMKAGVGRSPCRCDPYLSGMLYRGADAASGLFFEPLYTAASNNVQASTQVTLQRLGQFTNTASSSLLLLNTYSSCNDKVRIPSIKRAAGGQGMMSYPNFCGRHKVDHRPDVYKLAVVAEAAGADLRILVLQRTAAHLLRSDVSRGFGGGLDNEAAILTANALALVSQLRLLDPRFFFCINLADMSDGGGSTPERVQQMWQYLLPSESTTDDPLHPDAVAKMLVLAKGPPKHVYKNNAEGNIGNDTSGAVAALTAAVAKVNEECRRSDMARKRLLARGAAHHPPPPPPQAGEPRGTTPVTGGGGNAALEAKLAALETEIKAGTAKMAAMETSLSTILELVSKQDAARAIGSAGMIKQTMTTSTTVERVVPTAAAGSLVVATPSQGADEDFAGFADGEF